jgi:hypothetical protein
LMEFQGVRRKTSQIGKARITRAKVVDGKLHPPWLSAYPV